MNWLLLRGWGRVKGHWGDFPLSLESQLKSGRVLCLDLPGFGEFASTPPFASMSATVEWLRDEWLKHRDQNDQPWGILGLSLGGMIALDWVARFPQDFSGGVIVNSSHRSHSRPWERLQPRVWKKILLAMLARNSDQSEKYILQAVSEKKGEDPNTLALWQKLRREHPAKLSYALRQLGLALTAPALQKGSIPLLFVASQKDRLVNPICSERLAKYLNAPIVYSSSSGHDLPLDDSEWLVKQVMQFQSRMG